MQHDVPAKRDDPLDDPPELVHVGRAAEVRDEVEACCSDAGVVELADIGLGEGVVDHRYARVAAAAAMEGVDHGRVVCAVAAGLDEDRS